MKEREKAERMHVMYRIGSTIIICTKSMQYCSRENLYGINVRSFCVHVDFVK